MDSIKHASILSYQLGSTQISSHKFNPAPINSGQLRTPQTKLMTIHIISSLPASHPLPTTLSPVSLRFPSTPKHILSILPLSIYIQTDALLSLPAFHPLPIRAARRLTRSVLGCATMPQALAGVCSSERLSSHFTLRLPSAYRLREAL